VSTTSLYAASDAVMKTITAEINTLVMVNGTSGADRLYADGLHNTIMTAGDGNDVLTGGGIAHNTLIGGAGDDTYYVYSSNDIVQEQAGQGYDLVVAAGNYTLTDNVEQLRLTGDARYGGGNALDNRITGTIGNDTIEGFGGNDDMSGGDGNDRVDGGVGNDIVDGGGGNDTVLGGDGADKVYGSAGSDSLAGGAGNDWIEGGAGADTLSGGAGTDVFYFREGDLSKTPDRIVDFSQADGDKIYLNAIDANTNATGDQAFKFINSDAFHHVAGELRVDYSGGVAHVYGDTNSDGVADFELDVVGVSAFKSTDFML
jgi:Ca2+-binding RTX toxin-like protein